MSEGESHFDRGDLIFVHTTKASYVSGKVIPKGLKRRVVTDD